MRYLEKLVKADLRRKMVLLSGPRQVGKTTFARSLMERDDLYLNWDDPEHRRILARRDWPDSSGLLVLDEIHKYAKWRNWLKGTYDTRKERHRFLVTGSARLDVYRRGGDSLLGRYHHWRMHPFCLAEIRHSLGRRDVDRELDRLMSLGGFPEPYLGGDETEAKRWRKERRDLVLREDLRDLERVREISQVSLLLDLLAERVGGPVVVANLAQDLEAKHKTVKHWMEIVERLYLGFLVFPFVGKMARAIRKTPKFFFYDNGEVPVSADGNPGSRFENLIATHLLKRTQFLEDSRGDRYSLAYLRDKEGHEVDFAVIRERIPIALIEAKWADTTPSPSLRYFGERLGVRRRIQLVRELRRGFAKDGVEVLPASEWLSRSLEAELF